MRSLVTIIWMMAIALPSLADTERHDLRVMLDPQTHRITASDTVTLPRALAHGKTYSIVLHRGLAPKVTTALARLELKESGNLYDEFVLTLPPGAREVTFSYGGEIFHPLSDDSTEMAGGMRQSAGIISPDGVFLEGGSGWYPRFGDDPVAFTLEVQLPAGWDVVSQGARTKNESGSGVHTVRWEEKHPQDEIYLIAARYTEYARATDGVQAQVFLRTPDEALANTYLDATAKYVQLYSGLLGAYPYAKFALAENFWESGYGMPSFTLLGSKVIRLPFIVHSSYPHEILHNWWGNGVYVDYASGNWAEGLTSYLADHLLAEQRGDGANHRRAALQKYADFVRGEKDLPLTEFRSRHSQATEAVGYGKTLMLFHMLRLKLGDEKFIAALREFYKQFQFKVAGFKDVKQVFGVVDEDFDPWVKRPGAPELKLSAASAQPADGGYEVKFTLEQTQSDAPFSLDVPVAIQLKDTEFAQQTRVRLADRRGEFSVRVSAPPLRVDVDPEFDVFRRLDRAEIPPALSQLFGADKVLVLMPIDEPVGMRDAYEALARAWQQAEPGKYEIKRDVDVKQLPADRAVWILGWENRWRHEFAKALRAVDSGINNSGLILNGKGYAKSDLAVALALRHPVRADLAIGWIAARKSSVVTALTRKLPHYARYSYVGFEPENVTNTLKGQWPAVDSPLSVRLQADALDAPLKLAPRAALAR